MTSPTSLRHAYLGQLRLGGRLRAPYQNCLRGHGSALDYLNHDLRIGVLEDLLGI